MEIEREDFTKNWAGNQVKLPSGVRLYYEMKGAGPALLCLHNFSSNSRVLYRGLIPVLANHFSCYLVDIRGHGRSDNPSETWTHEQCSWDIIEFCRTLNLPNAFFLAASSGAMAMLRVARYAPELVRAMALDSTTYRVPVESRRYYKSPDSLSPRLKKYYESANEIYGPSYWRMLAQTFYDFRLPECDINVDLQEMKNIKCPTLIIAGDRDFFFPVEIPVALHRTIPNSSLFVHPNTSHIVMQDHPKLVAELARDFFIGCLSHSTPA